MYILHLASESEPLPRVRPNVGVSRPLLVWRWLCVGRGVDHAVTGVELALTVACDVDPQLVKALETGVSGNFSEWAEARFPQVGRV